METMEGCSAFQGFRISALFPPEGRSYPSVTSISYWYPPIQYNLVSPDLPERDREREKEKRFKLRQEGVMLKANKQHNNYS